MKRIILSVAVLALTLAVGTAQASLSKTYQFNGKGNWSLDAVGSNDTPVGDISAIVPVGSTVEKAFLYSSIWNTAISSPILPIVDFDGTIISGPSWTNLGTAIFPLFPAGGLTAFRADVNQPGHDFRVDYLRYLFHPGFSG